ncbi:F0F1 ATP synthase subunit A [Aurantibacillus circumpalustris]|uniref:F0F1 ATP synthase subunit A n=1 Tax=Aurantibacillus circumpalustris TaxID=3036359 RepID=UPI00295B4478|nr:F0F1 ATP synthase subunit A [Aurantibacillus circumpalustris]
MANKINTSGIKQLVLAIIFTFISFFAFSSSPVEHDSIPHEVVAEAHAAEAHAKPKVNISEIAFEHILDSHSWHLWGEHEDAVSMPLPVILKTNNGLVTFMSSEFHHDAHGMHVVEKNGERFVNYKESIYYASETANEHGQFVTFEVNEKGEAGKNITNAMPFDFSITKNVTQLLFSALLLILIFTSVARAYKTHGVTSAPKGKQSFLEPLIVFVRDDIAKENIGSKGEKFVPYLLTVFFLILINNIFGLIPISANLTGNIAFTLVLSICTLVVTNINGNKHYWGHIFTPHAPKALWPILIPIEIIGIFTKPFALMIRLFANISAGHIIIISLVGLIFLFESVLISPVSVAFALFIDVLEVLVAVLQAYIFTLLTSLFIGSAVGDTNEDGAHTSDDDLAHAKH